MTFIKVALNSKQNKQKTKKTSKDEKTIFPKE